MNTEAYNKRGTHWQIPLILLLHIALYMLIFNTVEEDAFIYLRFAKNIADGWGYVFNIGGERVESGTSLIWVMLLALFIKLPLSPILVMKFLGLIFSLLTILVTGRLTWSLTASRNAELLSMAMIATSYPLVYWAGQGLETPLVAFLLSANLLCMIDSRWRKGLWLSCVALALVRPESPIYLSMVLIWGTWQGYCGDRKAQRDALHAIGLAIVAWLSCTAWRVWYFGDFVVHPFYFKSDHLSASSPLALLANANRHLRLDLFLAPVIAALFLKKLPVSAGLLAIALALQLAWYVNLSDHFPFERHLVPGLAPLYALSIVACRSLARGTSYIFQRLIWTAALLMPLITVIQYQQNPLLQFGGLFVREPIAYLKAVGEKLINPEAPSSDLIDTYLQGQPNILAMGHNWEIGPGRFIAAAYPKNSIVAYHEMGQTPYYAGQDKQFIDTAGLVTRRVGFYKFGTSFDARPMAQRLWKARCAVLSTLNRGQCPSLQLAATINYILEQRPDVVMAHPIVAGIFGQNLPPIALIQDETFRQLYEKRYIIDGMIQVYERKDRNFPALDRPIPGVEIQRLH